MCWVLDYASLCWLLATHRGPQISEKVNTFKAPVVMFRVKVSICVWIWCRLLSKCNIRINVRTKSFLRRHTLQRTSKARQAFGSFPWNILSDYLTMSGWGTWLWLWGILSLFLKDLPWQWWETHAIFEGTGASSVCLSSESPKQYFRKGSLLDHSS